MWEFSVALAVAGASAGVRAADLWYRASEINFNSVGRMRAGGTPEAVNDMAQWIFEIVDQIKLSIASPHLSRG